MAPKRKVDERGIPTHCTGCGKRVLDGDGNQEVTRRCTNRFCNKCWKKHNDELEAKR